MDIGREREILIVTPLPLVMPSEPFQPQPEHDQPQLEPAQPARETVRVGA